VYRDKAMSRPENVSTGKMRLYDDAGRAMLPSELIDSFDLRKGDELKIVVEGDMAKMYKIDENGDLSP
jgi:bifunctional DNA-binding transcriptional regulator/antitoxin component of YhaV-PrlF toxin-antitoxin module